MNMCLAVAYLQFIRVGGLVLITEDLHESERLVIFMDYFVQQWMDSLKFLIEL